jgi:hypothetical protein
MELLNDCTMRGKRGIMLRVSRILEGMELIGA